jgi:hypothetical protein
MNSKSWPLFALGLVVGAVVLFVAMHFPHLFFSPTKVTLTDAVGYWEGSLHVEDHDVDISLRAMSDGTTLSGTIRAPEVGAIPCDHLTVDSQGNVTFSLHVQDKTGTFTGKLDPVTHTMTGALSSDVGAGNWSLMKK